MSHTFMTNVPNQQSAQQPSKGKLYVVLHNAQGEMIYKAPIDAIKDEEVARAEVQVSGGRTMGAINQAGIKAITNGNGDVTSHINWGDDGSQAGTLSANSYEADAYNTLPD